MFTREVISNNRNHGKPGINPGYILLSLIIVSIGVMILSYLRIKYQDNQIPLTGKETQTHRVCEEKGGTMHRVGRARGWLCIFTYSDGGTTCTSSDQCEGGCLGKMIFPDDPCVKAGTCKAYGVEKIGTCAHNTNPFGCKGTVESEGIHCLD